MSDTTIVRLATLRKCKAGAVPRPALFHGWFQYGNSGDGMDAMGVVEFEDGTTNFFSAGYITFDTPPTAEQVEGANLQPTNTGMAGEAPQVCPSCGGSGCYEMKSGHYINCTMCLGTGTLRHA